MHVLVSTRSLFLARWHCCQLKACVCACYDFVASLSLAGTAQTEGGPRPSEADNGRGGADQKLVTATGGESQTDTPASGSPPTLLALQQLESADAGVDNQSATRRSPKDGEATKHRGGGTANAQKQSRSFQMLEQGLRMAEESARAQGSRFLRQHKRDFLCQRKFAAGAKPWISVDFEQNDIVPPSFEHVGLTCCTLLSPSITFSLFHSELKTYFYYPPPVPP